MSTRPANPKPSDELPPEFRSVQACVDRGLPPQLMGEGLSAAVNERPDNILPPQMTPMVGMAVNAHPGPAMAVVATKLWKPGRTLRVAFLDAPPPAVRQQIEAFAHQWESHANIKFAFANGGDAEIRITCTPGIGSWSYLGTDALVIPAGKATMNYGWFTAQTPDTEFSRTTLHEFGHALGCIHEHMNPTGGIPWNRDAVYRYYTTTQGWTKADVDAQVLAKYDAASLNAGTYDPTSIMHYPVPKELTLDQKFSVGFNMQLSTQDKAFIRRQYP